MKKVPRIILFKGGHEIHYNGVKNFTTFFQFIEKKFEMDTVQELNSVDELEQMKKKHKMFFVRFILFILILSFISEKEILIDLNYIYLVIMNIQDHYSYILKIHMYKINGI